MAAPEPSSERATAQPRRPGVLVAASGGVAAIKFGSLCRGLAEWADVRAVAAIKFGNPFTRRHLHVVCELGMSLIPPVTKRLACGDYGDGAMQEPSEICRTVRLFYGPQDLQLLQLN